MVSDGLREALEGALQDRILHERLRAADGELLPTIDWDVERDIFERHLRPLFHKLQGNVDGMTEWVDAWATKAQKLVDAHDACEAGRTPHGPDIYEAIDFCRDLVEHGDPSGRWRQKIRVGAAAECVKLLEDLSLTNIHNEDQAIEAAIATIKKQFPLEEPRT